jgi:membrane fusion protein, copper/silver efflux system
MNIRTERVGESGGLSAPLSTTGRVVVDERRVAAITSYTAGRVERLYANFVGDTVRRGSAVATIYSPELFSAQQEYLVAIRNRDRMRASGYAQARGAADDLVSSSATRLRLLGLTAADLRRLERGGTPVQNVTISAPVSGVVTQKLVLPQQYVAAGQPLLQVADLSVVWVEADLYEQAISTVTPGSRAQVTFPALPGFEVAAIVSFVQPSLDPSSRSVRVRLEVPNPRLQLKLEMYANVRFATMAPSPRLSIASGAIIDRGSEQFVWVETAPGRYDPRRVVVGARAGARTEIVKGLTPGETIVTDGAFLLDSESQLQSATTSTHDHGSAQ